MTRLPMGLTGLEKRTTGEVVRAEDVLGQSSASELRRRYGRDDGGNAEGDCETGRSDGGAVAGGGGDGGGGGAGPAEPGEGAAGEHAGAADAFDGTGEVLVNH